MTGGQIKETSLPPSPFTTLMPLGKDGVMERTNGHYNLTIASNYVCTPLYVYIRSLRCPLSALALVGGTSPYGIGSHTAGHTMYRLARALKPNELTVREGMGVGGGQGSLVAQPHVGCGREGDEVVGVRYRSGGV